MDWLDLGKKIASMGLTTLGTVVGGPAGGAIGAMLGKALLGDKESEITPDKIVKTFGDPETLIKMRQFEMTHELELQKLVIQTEQLRLADVANARLREVDTTKATGKRDYNLYALAWVLIIGFFSLVALLVFRELPKDSNGVIFMLFGTLATGFGCVIQYFFGSSKSSSDKTQLLIKAEAIREGK